MVNALWNLTNFADECEVRSLRIIVSVAFDRLQNYSFKRLFTSGLELATSRQYTPASCGNGGFSYRISHVGRLYPLW